MNVEWRVGGGLFRTSGVFRPYLLLLVHLGGRAAVGPSSKDGREGSRTHIHTWRWLRFSVRSDLGLFFNWS